MSDADRGPRVELDISPGSICMHELLDRASVMIATWSAVIDNHPGCFEREAIKKASGQVMDMLADFYTYVGQFQEPGVEPTATFTQIRHPYSTAMDLYYKRQKGIQG